MRRLTGAAAYRQSAGHRDLRAQEVDVFLRVNAVLRSAGPDDVMARARAIADNERLWITVMDIMRDPANQLPMPIRTGLLALGHTVRKEHARETPDLAFLIGINEQIALGLSAA